MEDNIKGESCLKSPPILFVYMQDGVEGECSVLFILPLVVKVLGLMSS